MKKIRILALALAAAMVTASVTGCGSGSSSGSASTAAASGGNIKIGLVAPLSGDSGVMGESQQHGYELAINEINAAGGVNGKKLELTTYDDQGDPQKAASGAQKFADDESILAIGGSCNSSATLAMAPIIDAAGLPDLVVSSSSPALTGCSDYFFRMAVQDNAVGPQMAQALLDRGKKNIVVFYPNNDYGTGLNTNLKNYMEQKGGKVLSSLTYLATDQDFTAQITTAKGLNPDAIALCGTPADSGLIIKQLKQNGVNVPIIGGTGLYNSKTVEIAGDSCEGIYVIGVYVANNPDQKVQDLVKKYQEKYGSVPDGFAALAYDQMYVIAEAAKKAGDKLSRDTLKDALKETNYSGVTGTVKFDSNNDWVRDYLTLTVKDGNFVMADK